ITLSLCWRLWLSCLIPFTSQGQDESIALPPIEEMAPIDSIEGIKKTEREDRISFILSHFLLKEDRKKLKVKKEGSNVYEQNEPQIEKVDQWEIPFLIGVLRWERKTVRVTVAIYRGFHSKLITLLLLTFQYWAGVRLYTSCYHLAESCVFNKQSLPPDHKSILYGLSTDRFGVEFSVELNVLEKSSIEICELITGYNWERIVGRATTAPQGGRTGGRTGRRGGRTRGRSGDQGNGGIDGQGGQVGGQGTEGDVRNFIENNDRRSCTYKEFLACNLKDYDGKGGAMVYTHWIKKMESVQDMSRCRDNQKVKYTTGSFVSKALTCWNSQIYTRSREAAVGMSWEDFKTLTSEEFCPINELQKLETEFWNHAMVGAG
nr:reverse transcriptase domain-containing protein [Tanacetum cinerariifolium]